MAKCRRPRDKRRWNSRSSESDGTKRSHCCHQLRTGENNGRSLRHDFVVLSLDHQKLASGPQEFHLPSSAPEIANRPNRTALAAWVTRAGDIAPLQATGGWL